MRYSPYQTRLNSYIPALSEAEKILIKKQTAEYGAKRELSTRVDALQRRYQELQAVLKKISPSSRSDEADRLVHEIKNLEYEIDGHRLALLDHETKGDQFGNEWLILREKMERLETLAGFDGAEMPAGRPVIDSLKTYASGREIFNGTAEPDAETVSAMKEMIRKFRILAISSEMQIENLERSLEWAKLRRTDAVSRATVENQKVQRAYDELANSIEIEANTRVGLNMIADIAEIAVEGKSLPGAAAQALSKLGEAYFIVGMGKGVTMYDPASLFKEYGDGRERVTMRPDLSNAMARQGERTLYATLREMVVGARGLQSFSARKAVETTLKETLRQGRKQAEQEIFDADIMARLIKNLSQQDEALAKALRESFDLAQRKAIISQQELIRDELAKQVARRVARIGTAHAIDASMKEMSEKLLKMSVKDVLEETLTQAIKNKVKAGAGSVARGLAWDSLRAGVQTAIDFHAEAQWKNFLDRLLIADVVNKQMIFTNIEIAEKQHDMKVVSDQKAIYLLLLSAARELYREYLTDRVADATLHKMSKTFSSKEMPLDLYLDIVGSTRGEKLFLKGDLGVVQLEYADGAAFPEAPMDDDGAMDRELSPESTSEDAKDKNQRPDRAWHYRLPDGTDLSEVSKTNGLLLIVEVQ